MTKQKQPKTPEAEETPELLQDAVKKPEIPADLLNRGPFVERVFRIADTFHQDKKSACYAINGAWGTGKSYVLDLLEQRLTAAEAAAPEEEAEPAALEEASLEAEGEAAEAVGEEAEPAPPFLVLRYNCWEYDYYDEPLVSLVATMQETIEKKEPKKHSKLLTILKALGQTAKNLAFTYVDSMAKGIPSAYSNAYQEVSEEEKNKAQKKGPDAYDGNLPFRTALRELRKILQDLAGESTVVLLVDELDRCLPEYAVRVLERLHHLFEGIKNIQVIFSVDRGQLEHVIQELFGADADTAAYLKKFISFELKLDQGSLNLPFNADFNEERDGTFDQRFASYVSLFAPCEAADLEPVTEFKARILDGFDIRRRIALVEKAELIHRLLWTKAEKPSQYYLCLELFLVLAQTVRDLKGLFLKLEKDDYELKISVEFTHLVGPKNSIPDGVQYLNVIIQNNISPNGGCIYFRDYQGQYFNTCCLPGFLVSAIYHIWEGNKVDEKSDASNENHVPFAREFWQLVTIME
jgi:Cdc6-like AAA superfamily ATPase